MALKYQITKEEFEQLDETQQQFYVEAGDGYQLEVEGIDDGKELKEALRKEREERAAAKKRAQELEEQQQEAERKRLEEQQEYQELYKKEQETRAEKEKRLQELEDKVANGERMATAEGIVSPLIDKDAPNGADRYEDLREKAAKFISYTPEGVKINGPDGEAWSAKQLSEHLSAKYPYIVDGSKASGGGAPGNKGGGAATQKTFDQMTGAELSELRQSNPEEYQRLRDQFHNS